MILTIDDPVCRIYRMPTTHMKFKKNGRTHVALLMAKSLKRWFTTKDLREMSNLFTDVKRTSQSLNLLRTQGLLQKQGDKWAITTEGIRFVYLTAHRNPMAQLED